MLQAQDDFIPVRARSKRLLGDLVFLRWYRDRVKDIVGKACSDSGLMTIKSFDRVVRSKREGEPRYQQRDLEGQVVDSVLAFKLTADHFRPIFESLLASAARDLAWKHDVHISVKEVRRAGEKAANDYTQRSPGPAISWVHDMLRARVSLDDEWEICAAVEYFERKTIRLKNRFAKPTALGYSDLLLLIVLSDDKTNIVCELQLVLEPLFQFATQHHCQDVYDVYRDLFAGHEDTTIRKRLKLFEKIEPLVIAVASRQQEREDRVHRVIAAVLAATDAGDMQALAELLELSGDYAASLALRERHVQLSRGYLATAKVIPCNLNGLCVGGGVLEDWLGGWSPALFAEAPSDAVYAYAVALLETGKPALAAEQLRRALVRRGAEMTSSADSKSLGMAQIYDALGVAWYYANELEAAETQLRLAFSVRRRVASLKSEADVASRAQPKMAQTCVNLGLVLARQGKLQLAISNLERAVEIYERCLGDFAPATGKARFDLANVYRELGREDSALAQYRAARRLLAGGCGKHHSLYLACVTNLAIFLERHAIYEGIELDEIRNELKCVADHLYAGETKYVSGKATISATYRNDRRSWPQARSSVRRKSALPRDGRQSVSIVVEDGSSMSVLVQSAARTAFKDHSTNSSSCDIFVRNRAHLEYLDGGVSTSKVLDDYESGAYDECSRIVYDGRLIGKVERVLGKGSFGTVHLFRSTESSNAAYAMKVLDASKGSGIRLTLMLCEEAGINFAVGVHANVVSMRRVLVPLRELRTNIESVIILSDFVPGRSLESWMTDPSLFHVDGQRTSFLDGDLYRSSIGRPLSISERCLCLVLQIFLGLKHCHRHCVLHQDVKPANCLVTPEWWLRLTDYGLSKHTYIDRDPWQKVSVPCAVLCAELKGGSPAYMSPQGRTILSCIANNGTLPPSRLVTPATSDLWAAAVITLELYSRRRVHENDNSQQQFIKYLDRIGPDSVAPTESHPGAELPRAPSNHQRIELLDMVTEAPERVSLRMPSALTAEIAKIFSSDVGDRPRDCDQVLLALGYGGDAMPETKLIGYSLLPDQAKVTPVARPAVDTRGTLGSIARLLEHHREPLLALEAHKEVVGVISREFQSNEVAGWCALARRSSKKLRKLDFSREMRAYWKMLLTTSFEEIMQAAIDYHAQDVKEIDFSDQSEIECTLDIFTPFINLERLEMQRCFGLYGSQYGAASHSLEQRSRKNEAHLGELAPLRKLSKLVHLSLSGCNEISGTLDPIANLEALIFVDISGGGNSDYTIEVKGTLEPLRGLVNIRHLRLYDCDQLKGTLEPLSNLRELEKLNLYNSDGLEGNLDPLGSLIHIVELDLACCRGIRGEECARTLQPLARMPQLRLLNLACVGVTGSIEPLSSLVNLTTLNVFECDGLTGSLEPLSRLVNLVDLNCGRCPRLEGTLDPLRRLTKLLNLVICEDNFDGSLEPLHDLTALNRLEVQGSIHISGSLPETLNDLPRLRLLRVGGCSQLGDIDDWKELHPRCQVDQSVKVDDGMYFYS